MAQSQPKVYVIARTIEVQLQFTQPQIDSTVRSIISMLTWDRKTASGAWLSNKHPTDITRMLSVAERHQILDKVLPVDGATLSPERMYTLSDELTGTGLLKDSVHTYLVGIVLESNGVQEAWAAYQVQLLAAKRKSQGSIEADQIKAAIKLLTKHGIIEPKAMKVKWEAITKPKSKGAQQ